MKTWVVFMKVTDLKNEAAGGAPTSDSGLGLLSCPFCGGSAMLRTDGVTAITCDACGILFSNGHRSMRGLVGDWNRRPNK